LASRRPRARDGSAAQDDDGPDEDDFLLLEEDLNEITAEVNDLAKFVQLNYTGFQKVIKKHDVSLMSSLTVTADQGRNKLNGSSNLSSQRD